MSADARTLRDGSVAGALLGKASAECVAPLGLIEALASTALHASAAIMGRCAASIAAERCSRDSQRID